ncbi:hypothetical protein GBA63_15940 [Rubrobacter tropicus]|uniref:Uncharacterized protein n=1 Tax=Rubrobacter tropicus TaxID=2653851 RepID=A0A6G8QC08_9ACTN|nr:hypothetical protein [Rubrobacter tropicus]QIN83973.1 hypothetical protein GBA63_15940 [Rubrobacter tropicus]
MGRRAVHFRRPPGRFPLGFAPVLILAGFLALASAGPYFPFVPLIPLFFVLFFLTPRGGRPQGAPEVRPARDGGEKELLRALERNEEITAARAALETTLSVAEAEKMLTKLAAGGHVEVRAREGHLTYALRFADRREVGPKDLANAEDGPAKPRGLPSPETTRPSNSPRDAGH